MAFRLTKAKKQKLARKRADLARSLKEAEQVANNRDRMQLFIDVCRQMLPKETYAALWERVDLMDGGL